MSDARVPKNLSSSAIGWRSPFLWVGIAWAAIGLIVAGAVDPTDNGASWMLSLWFLCMIDLFAMARAIEAAMRLMSLAPDSDLRPAAWVQAIFWGVAKLLCLAAFGLALWQAHQAPYPALLLGVSTLLVVPLVGGYWWSQKELKHA